MQRDPDFGWIADDAGPPQLSARRVPGGPFAQLARSITYQQLAGAAAATIHGRFVALFDGPPTPEAVVAAPLESLRAAGLSAAKAASIIDLAEKTLAGEVRLSRLSRMTDEQVVAELIQVRGIGRWTAEMYLIFALVRPDVWPTGDLAVRAGYAVLKRLPVPPSSRDLEAMGDPLLGLRSVAAWYCWRASERGRVSPIP